MNIYREFATHLDQLLGGVQAVRITVSGFMPLSVEEIGFSDDGHRLVSLCQYGEQNGDLMRDPWERRDYERHAALRATAALGITNQKTTRPNRSRTLE